MAILQLVKTTRYFQLWGVLELTKTEVIIVTARRQSNTFEAHRVGGCLREPTIVMFKQSPV